MRSGRQHDYEFQTMFIDLLAETLTGPVSRTSGTRS